MGRLTADFAKAFSRDLKKNAKRRNWNLTELEKVIDLVVENTPETLEELRRRLVRARRETAERLLRLAIEPVLSPRGGFSLWCRLPDGLDSTPVAQAAVAEGVVLAPGNVFSISQGAANLMRFNVAHMIEPRVYAVLERAMRQAG